MSNPNADTRFSIEVVEGSPEGVEYGGPRLAFDRVGKGLYAKTTRAAINTGWVLIGSGAVVPPPPPSTSHQQLYKFAGDPNGNVTALTTLPCICLDTSVGGPSSGQIFWKVDGLISNNGWV